MRTPPPAPRKPRATEVKPDPYGDLAILMTNIYIQRLTRIVSVTLMWNKLGRHLFKRAPRLRLRDTWAVLELIECAADAAANGAYSAKGRRDATARAFKSVAEKSTGKKDISL